MLQVGVSGQGRESFFLIDPQGGSLTVLDEGGSGGSGGVPAVKVGAEAVAAPAAWGLPAEAAEETAWMGAMVQAARPDEAAASP